MTGWARTLASLGLAALLAACGERGRAVPEGVTGEPREVTYAPGLGVDLDAMTHSPSGLYFEDLVQGSGPPATAGDRVVVHYDAWLANGEKFDSSRNAGQPLTFTLGTGEVISGWDEGVAGMQAGGRRRLVIPPGLAYGEAGAGGVIPGNATLVFEVEMLEIR